MLQNCVASKKIVCYTEFSSNMGGSMNPVMIWDFLQNKEVEADPYRLTGLYPGARVRHANAGQFAGSNGAISHVRGTVIKVDYQGVDMNGSNVFTALVKWDDGRTYNLRTGLCVLVESEAI
jgi:hypothetical protein